MHNPLNKRDVHSLRIFLRLTLSVTPRDELNLFKIFIYIHKNIFEPQLPDYLEKLVESLLYNFHREHLLLKLKIKKLLRKISSKNFTAGVIFLLF